MAYFFDDPFPPKSKAYAYPQGSAQLNQLNNSQDYLNQGGSSSSPDIPSTQSVIQTEYIASFDPFSVTPPPQSTVSIEESFFNETISNSINSSHSEQTTHASGNSSNNSSHVQTSLVSSRTCNPEKESGTLTSNLEMAYRDKIISTISSSALNELSGTIYARVSTRSLLTKDWKEVCYFFQESVLLIFRNQDHMQHYFNLGTSPHREQERQNLIKCTFVISALFKCTSINVKEYKDINDRALLKKLHHFSLEEIRDYGSVTLGKFASEDLSVVTNLRNHLMLLCRQARKKGDIMASPPGGGIASRSVVAPRGHDGDGSSIQRNEKKLPVTAKSSQKPLFDIWSGTYVEDQNHCPTSSFHSREEDSGHKTRKQMAPHFVRKESAAEISSQFGFS